MLSIVFKKSLALFYLSLPVLICVAWQFVVLKDLNWDAVNYHLYAGLSFVEGRLNQDFMPAGPQSYLNPIGYLPFYWLVTYVKSPVIIACSLAVIHSTLIYLTIVLIKLITSARFTQYQVLSTTILSLLTNVYWHQVGSSFIDVYVGILVLMGLIFLIKYSQNSGLRWLLFSSFVLGIAVGLKLTAAVYAIALTFCALYIIVVRKHKKFMHFAYFSVSGVIGAVLIQGWWAYQVYMVFDNPFYPYFNSIFCSGFHSCESIINFRFVPESFIEALLFPIHMALPSSWLYQELLSPDIRLLLLYLCLPLAAYKYVSSKISLTENYKTVGLFFVVSYVLWLSTSGNGRYGMPVLILAGIILAITLYAALGNRRGNLYITVVCALQMTVLFMSADFRWDGRDWGQNYYEYTNIKELKKEPYLYVSVSKQSNSFLAAYTHKDSSFINLTGQLPLSKPKAIERFKKLIERQRGNIRFINEIGIEKNTDFVNSDMIVYQSLLARFSLKIQPSTCSATENTDFHDKQWDFYLVYCEVEVDDSVNVRFQENVLEADLIFDKIEQFCPQHFNPSNGITEQHGPFWFRYYVGTEKTLFLKNEELSIESALHPYTLPIGNKQSWISNPEIASNNCVKDWTRRHKSVQYKL